MGEKVLCINQIICRKSDNAKAKISAIYISETITRISVKIWENKTWSASYDFLEDEFYENFRLWRNER